MIISELTTAEVTKLISLLSEEIAALSVRSEIYPERQEENNKIITQNEIIIEKLERMH